MSAMDEFGAAEPKECLIIWADEAGDMCWACTTDSMYIKLGMLEFMRAILNKQIADNMHDD